MKSSCLFEYLSCCRFIAVGLVSVVILSGCGGGTDTTAGVGSGGTGTIAVAGSVADGYLVNASVFLDKNGNYQLDTGEPFTTTGANGGYKLDVDPADVGRYPIVALVIKGVTIDKDTNQPVANSYILSMPKSSVNGSVSNFISPVTSQLREMMETGIYATVQQAMDAMRTRMGLVLGTDVMSDYIASGNTTMHTGAQNMATLMGNQMGLVFLTSGSTTFVDVNRYRGMMGMIFSNMSTPMGTSTQTTMTTLNNNITTMMSNMTPMSPGQPYKNMSSSFRRTMPGM